MNKHKVNLILNLSSIALLTIGSVIHKTNEGVTIFCFAMALVITAVATLLMTFKK